MALFRRQVPLSDAIAAVQGELLARKGTPLAPELSELSRLLREDEAKTPPELQELLHALPDAAGVVGKNGRIVAANPRLDLLLDAGRSIGRTLLEATRSAELHQAGERALEGAATSAELTLPSLQKVVLATLAPLSRKRALLVLRDLTESKRSESVRRDFIANASHELRTPVSAISGAVETPLSGPPLHETARGFVEMIARHAERLSRLTTDLLDLSRLETGEFRPELQSLDVAAVCASVLELFRGRAEAKHILLGCDAPQDLRVFADRRALEQILVNLLENAVKFTPEAGRVTLLADGLNTHVVFSVIDTGSGIEPRHQERIFERFYRADTGRSREAGGIGLGLAIVKHLAHVQGGEVGVESGQGGSRFWVKLRAAG